MFPVWLSDSVTPNLSRGIHYTLLWGLEGVVLRTVGTLASRVPFVNEHQLRSRLADAELPIFAVDPGLFEGHFDAKAAWMNDLMLLDEAAEFCKRVGCPLIMTGGLADSGIAFDVEAAADVFRKAGPIAQKHGVTLAISNDASTNCSSGSTLRELLAAIDNPAVLAAWSPADASQAGADPDEGLKMLLDQDKIAVVIVRDGEMVGEDWIDRDPGEGIVGWESQIRQLAAAEFTGPMCLDVRGDHPAKFGLSQATSLIRMIRSAHLGTASAPEGDTYL